MIKILLDSSSDCHADDPCCDYFIPISINIDGREYQDGVDIDSDGFYSLLENGAGFPKTSLPSPQTYIDIFEKVKADGDELIYFAPSFALTGTYACACMARDMVGYEGIHVVDSKAASHMIGLMARLAARLIQAGNRVEDILAQCRDLRSKIRLIVGVDTLEYLRRGGRMNKTFATIGEITHIKPVITLTHEGTAEPLAKCLGRSRAMQFIVNTLKDSARSPAYPLYSLYTHGLANCQQLERKLSALGLEVAQRLQIGSTIGTHAGPSVYGVLYVEE